MDDDETNRLRKMFDEGKLTCEEAGDRCKNECTVDGRTGLIKDPDCFR